MMASGKSTVGPVLARLLHRRFVDNDHRVREIAGRSIPEIFESEGEAAFRALEARAIREAGQGDAVVALGGGAIAQPGAPELLAETGTVVYLQAGVNALMERVGVAAGRPLLAHLTERERRERIEQMLSDREDAYRSAEIMVETDGMSVQDVARAIVRALDEEGP